MVGSKIKELREKAGITQSALAEKMNVTRQTISSWETGRTEPDTQSLKRLAEVFGTDINNLTGFAVTKEKVIGDDAKKPRFEFFSCCFDYSCHYRKRFYQSLR